jgi:hypothetical protein
MKQSLVVVVLWISLAAVITVAAVAQGIGLNDQGPEDSATLQNDRSYSHAEDNNLEFNFFNSLEEDFGRAPFLLASQEGQDVDTLFPPFGETGGIYGDGDVITLWSPGDGAILPSDPPVALIYVVDEDAWDDDNGDPYDNGAIKAYLDFNGVWQISDRSQKSRIERMEGALSRLRAINGYSYEFKLTVAEVAKGQQPVRRLGVLAQEVQTVLPEAVASNAYGEMWVNYSQITPLLIEAIKEQQTVIEELRARVAALEGQHPFLPRAQAPR